MYLYIYSQECFLQPVLLTVARTANFVDCTIHTLHTQTCLLAHISLYMIFTKDWIWIFFASLRVSSSLFLSLQCFPCHHYVFSSVLLAHSCFLALICLFSVCLSGLSFLFNTHTYTHSAFSAQLCK